MARDGSPKSSKKSVKTSTQNANLTNVVTYEVKIETLSPRILAAVRRRIAPKDVSSAFKPALDQVWAFLGRNAGLRSDGHNIFLYHHETPAIMSVDFGVEVVRPFAGEDEVACVTTPKGEAAVIVHRGPYVKMSAAHQALHRWCAVHGRTIGGHSLEIYGDWCDDPEKLETTIQYLLL
jgi:effector-binding domain-containing protein